VAGQLIAWGELALVAMFLIWTFWGMARFFWQTGGALDGLLTLLDEKWKGVLILAAFLFLPVVRPLVKNVKFKAGPLEGNIDVLPPSAYENPPNTTEPTT
jgi:hypothetical protein